MNRKSPRPSAGIGPRITRRTFTASAGALALTAGIAPFNIVRAQGAALKVGVILPRSGFCGRHRTGLPARRRYRRADPEGPRSCRISIS